MYCLSVDILIFVFFFKQKTAYEMRISDWSSDVCSSDLLRQPAAHHLLVQLGQLPREGRRPVAQHGDGILDQLGDPVRALVEHQGVRRGGIDLDEPAPRPGFFRRKPPEGPALPRQAGPTGSAAGMARGSPAVCNSVGA